MLAFDCVEIEAAAPADIGLSYGRKAAGKIRQCIESYRSYFSRHGGMTWEDLRAYAMAYVPGLGEAMPEVLEEARGIAAGADVPFEDIMVVNCRYEITKQPQAGECTTAAVLPRAAGGGTSFLVKNWDYRLGVTDHVIVLRIKCPGGVTILGLTEAGQLMREGFNSCGVGMVNNALKSIHDGPGTGIPVTFLRRRVLACQDFDEALGWILGAKRSVSNNMLLMSREGQAVDIEANPAGHDLIHPEAEIITHANHFTVNPGLENYRRSNRDKRLRELLSKRWGRIDAEYIQACLADHEGFPKSVCSHPEDTARHVEDRDITVAGIVIDMGAGVLHVCAGPPCSGGFQKYRV